MGRSPTLPARPPSSAGLHSVGVLGAQAGLANGEDTLMQGQGAIQVALAIPDKGEVAKATGDEGGRRPGGPRIWAGHARAGPGRRHTVLGHAGSSPCSPVGLGGQRLDPKSLSVLGGPAHAVATTPATARFVTAAKRQGLISSSAILPGRPWRVNGVALGTTSWSRRCIISPCSSVFIQPKHRSGQ